jgi:nitrite reductase/ring-hydroxylating ferredoxin subunit/Fe-S cluster biogenesis protein NfuA
MMRAMTNIRENNAPSGEASADESRRSLDALLSDIASLEALAQDWPEAQSRAAAARARAIDALNAEAFRRLIRALKQTPGFGAALRDAASDELVYTVLRRHGLLKPSLFERVQIALDGVRPMLATHGGDVELVAVDPPLAEVRFLGACDGCPASMLTFVSGVREAITTNVPEIREVRQIKGLGPGAGGEAHFVSPFAAPRAGGWSFAAKLREIADGETRIVVVGDHSLLLSRFWNSVTCFENACAHMGLPFDGGIFESGFVTCPHHGFQYALDSGECLTTPQVQLQPHDVRVVGDRIEVRLTS